MSNMVNDFMKELALLCEKQKVETIARAAAITNTRLSTEYMISEPLGWFDSDILCLNDSREKRAHLKKSTAPLLINRKTQRAP